MSVFDDVRDLMSTNNIYQTPYDRAAEVLGIGVEESRDAVREWFRERGYNLVEGQPLVNEDLQHGTFIMVEDDLYELKDNKEDRWIWQFPEEAGGIRFEFDELDYTGYDLAQFVWDKNGLWLIAVG